MRAKKINNQKVFNVLLLIDTSGTFGRGFLKGIALYSSNYSWNLVSFLRGIVTPDFISTDADGVIMYYSRTNMKYLAKYRPAILLGPPEKTKDFPHVRTDFAGCGRKCAEYLLNKGFRRFAYCGNRKIAWSNEYGEYFSKAIKEAGFETYIYRQPKVKTWTDERPFVVKWLKSLPKPIGLLAANDERAQYVINACMFANLRIPEDVSILSITNDELLCNLPKPPLSSLMINMEKAGYEAAELLHKFMTGREKMARQEIVIEPMYVVERQSTNILAVEDEVVAQVVQFIRKNAQEPIQVRDVVKVVAVSRRNLEMRFKKIFGHSILKEINQARVNQIIRLLIETDLSLMQIAMNLKYTSYFNICRFFKKETGISPLAYRKKHRYTLR